MPQPFDRRRRPRTSHRPTPPVIVNLGDRFPLTIKKTWG